MQIPIILELSADQLAKVQGAATAAKREDFNRYLGEIASNLTREVVDGGIFVPGREVKRLSSFHTETIDGATAIKLIEKAIGRDGDHLEWTYRIDDADINYFKEMAERSGRTVLELLKDGMTIFITEFHFARFADEVRVMKFSNAQYKQLADLIGKAEPSGADLMEALVSEPARVSETVNQ